MEQMNPVQIKKYLKQLKERRDQYLYYLGQLAYKAGEAGKLQDPEMVEGYGTLRDIQVQLAQCENSMEQIKAAREAAKGGARCPYCSSPVMKGAVFCGGCGQSLLQQQPGMVQAPQAAIPHPGAPGFAAATGKACPSCGAAVDADTVFCANCGGRVEVEPEAVQEAGAGTKACPSCGSACGDVHFCPECGTKI